MKYNTKTLNAGPGTKTVNLAGGEAFKVDNRTALYLTSATSLGGGQGNKYYVSTNQEYKNILALIEKVSAQDAEFIFQLAAYCRQDLNLRSIPTVLFIEGIRAMHKQKKANAPYPVDASKYANAVFGRADEIVEAVAYWLGVEGHHKLPAPLRKSLTIALNSFDEYRLLKYNQEDKQVTFKDIVRLVHPEPKNDVQSAIFKYFVKDEISSELMPKTTARKAMLSRTQFDEEARRLMRDSSATWETVIAKFGSTKEIWEAVIPNMGYMALLRNLNNFLKKEVDLDLVIPRLVNPQEIRKSKQLPFRFYTAMKQLGVEDNNKNSSTKYYGYSGYSDSVETAFEKWRNVNSSDRISRLRNALGVAMNIAVENVPHFSGRTVVAADLSGSMSQPLNNKSSVTYREIACIMAGIAGSIAPDNVICGFGLLFAVAKKGKDILETANNIDKLNVGMSTDAWRVLDYLLTNKIFVDRVMYFTDTQCYNSYCGANLNELWEKYKVLCQSTGKKVPVLYEVNLAGGNTSSFNSEQRVATIGGWSERIFDLITTYETDPRQAISKIKQKYSELVTV